MYLLLGGQAIAATDAWRAGLVEEVVPSEAFDTRLAELARSIAAAPPATVTGIKRSVDAVRPHRSPDLATDAIEAFASTWANPAHWKALEAMEKRRRAKK
jgi:enoyl-CoA hydratase/carnithine racemase